MTDTAMEWARATFGRAALGDQRLVRRLVLMSSAAARQPRGTVTATMPTAAEAEGAFRFLENERVEPAALLSAAGLATATMCADSRTVFVPVDQTELAYVDRQCIRGLGPIGTRQSKVMRSTQVMTAFALDERGVPLGVLDQQWWLRPEERTPWGKKDPRPAEERESWQWVRALRASHERLLQAAPETRPWFVIDRAGDFWGVLEEAKRSDLLVTVRGNFSRAIERNGKKQYLRSTLARQPVLGFVDVAVPARPDQSPRRARLELRALHASVRLRPKIHDDLYCVRVREVSAVPYGEAPIEWFLLTTYPVITTEDAKLVLRSYTLRWRIEEFHKAWKSGVCRVESSQLRSYDAIRRWGTILAAVAARAERLKHLSRETPHVDATEELSREEIDAAILLTRTKKWKPGDEMDLVTAVRLVAMAGGYLARKGDGPPGAITIGRGLERVVPAAIVLRASRGSG